MSLFLLPSLHLPPESLFSDQSPKRPFKIRTGNIITLLKLFQWLYVLQDRNPSFLPYPLPSSLTSSHTTLSPVPPAPPACLPFLQHRSLIPAFALALLPTWTGSRLQCHLPKGVFQIFPAKTASITGSSHPQPIPFLSGALVPL